MLYIEEKYRKIARKKNGGGGGIIWRVSIRWFYIQWRVLYLYWPVGLNYYNY
jgi:hypothetical protein